MSARIQVVRPGRRGLPSVLAAAAVVAILGAISAAIQLSTGEAARQPFSHVEVSPTSEKPDGNSGAAGVPLDVFDDVVSSLDRFASVEGYAGVTVSEPDRLATLWWSGPRPADVTNLNGNTIRGVRIQVATANFSQATLEAAGKKLLHAALARGIPITSVGPTRGYTGLSVSVDPDHVHEPESALVGLQQQLNSFAEAPVVEVTLMKRAVPR